MYAQIYTRIYIHILRLIILMYVYIYIYMCIPASSGACGINAFTLKSVFFRLEAEIFAHAC